MHIKTLRIQGFKSYRDQTAVEEFSPGHNVVVGRNGSGKSNFFAAIRFVLSDAYTSMNREDRQALLHDSSASVSATLSAFVEIVFDNSDGRFPHGSNNELTLRRTIGVKKDEYTLDRKSATKQDVMNMLEAAGFSRSNPYYIVPQGRITSLTNMKDEDRLNLLKEVAGTKVYETRRADSLRLMEETTIKKDDIMELLTYIAERLTELDEDRKELKEYHEKDKERRCLEYALFYKELQDVLGSMEDLEKRKAEDTSRIEIATGELTKKDAVLQSLEGNLKRLVEQESRQVVEKDSLIQERRELARLRASLESTILDEEERTVKAGESRPELEARASELDQRINDVEGELMGLIPLLEDEARELAQARTSLEDTKARLDVLLAKQTRSNQYQNQAERDTALQEEIRSLEAHESDQERRKVEVQEDVIQAEARIKEIEATMTQMRAQEEEIKAFIGQRGQTWDELQKQENILLEKRKSLWKEEEQLRATSSAKKVAFSKAEKRLAETMDRPTMQGLAAVEEITQRLNLTGVFGPFYKLFKVESTHKRAVEVTAGQSLFHVVVDSDETASKIIEVMNREKSGKVTFVPLNRIKPKTVAFRESTEAFLMINKLTFDAKFKLAMQQVFARTIICENLDVAASYVKSHGINAITLNGDRIERKGAMTGGYHDPSRSRLDAVQDISNSKEEYEKDMSRSNVIQQEIVDINHQITALASERQQLESRSRSMNSNRKKIKEVVQSLREEELSCQQRLQQLHLSLEQISREVSSSMLKRNALGEELKLPLRRGLQSEEEAEMKRLTLKADQEEKKVTEKVASINNKYNDRRLKEVELNGSLKKEREMIATMLEMMEDGINFSQEVTNEGGSTAQSLAARKKQLTQTKKQLNDRQKVIERLEKGIEGMQAEIKKLTDESSEMGNAIAAEVKELERQGKVTNKIAAKMKDYTSRKTEAERKIRELGIVPGEAYNKYTSQTAEQIVRKLHSTNANLKKFSNVNKRAVEQYDNFTKQRDQLLSRQTELEQSSESIDELIETLDMRKDEAIERTFRSVAKYFAEIFEKLVPMGRGRLIMQSKHDVNNDAADEEAMELDEPTPNIENYTGVSIRVSFNSKSDEGLRIQQLSGGQKSLVALAIVFALQKCDPAPFYLFDEIDANLDAQYRTSVAAMIQELGSEAQFITTTFRPELVGVGKKHYGVLFNAQKVSSLQPITQDDAYQFVEAASQAS